MSLSQDCDDTLAAWRSASIALVDRMATDFGHTGINPESLAWLMKEDAAGRITPIASKALKQVMDDLREMFAPVKA